jgi:uncharacterized membrane protein (UPF0127 family)
MSFRTTPPPPLDTEEGMFTPVQTPIAERIRKKMEQQLPIIQTIFGKDYKITIDATKKGFHVTDKKDKTCIIFNVFTSNKDKEYIYLNLLYKCGNLSGEEVITKMIQIARHELFRAKEIHLLDASTIFLTEQNLNCKFSLRILKILSTGQSWYNQYGFFSDPLTEDYEEYKQNKKLRNMTLEELLNKISEKKTSYGVDLFKTHVDALKDSDTNIYQQYKNKPVKLLAKEIDDAFKIFQANGEKECTSPIIKWYLFFLEVVNLSSIIKYDRNLVYKIPVLPHEAEMEVSSEYPVAGGNKKREKKTKREKIAKKGKRTKRTQRTQLTKRTKTHKKIYSKHMINTIINNHVFTTKVVNTTQSIAKGMMGATFDKNFNSMLFDFSEEYDHNSHNVIDKDLKHYRCFWMKNCIIPLDMIFIKDNVVQKVYHSCPPCNNGHCTSYCGYADCILEVHGGTCKTYNISAGNTVQFSR